MKKVFETMTFGDSPEFLNGDNCILYRGIEYFEASSDRVFPHMRRVMRNRDIWVSLGGKHRVQGDAIVFNKKFMEVPESILESMHDPEARTYSGALSKMREQHPDFQEDEIVSILIFRVHLREPQVGDEAYIMVDIPEDERSYDYEEGDRKVQRLTEKISNVKNLGSNLWEVTSEGHTGVVHSGESIKWAGIHWCVNR